MAAEPVDLTPQPAEPETLLALRARIATDIASGRRLDLIHDDLVAAIDTHVSGAVSVLIAVDDHDIARICASSAPSGIQRRIHGQRRRHWFGAWSAAIARRSDVTVTEIAASSLYSDQRRHFIEHGLLAVRALPIAGRHGTIAGALAVYLDESRVLNAAELDALDEIADLVSLSVRHDAAHQELLDRIRHDPLTGLENRDGLEDHIQRALDAARGRSGIVALLVVDIDDLTLVNDSLSHTVGDLVIAATADRIRRQLLPGDTVVRFGGDEFIVVLERIDDLGEAQTVSERIRAAIGEPITVDDNELAITVSIGIACAEPGIKPLALIDNGHAAVVRAKQAGRGSTTVHDESLDTGAADRLGREQQLRHGLEDQQFRIFWQPKVSLATGRIVGAEALVRWEHPERGTIGPDEFIATAERAGLISDLSDWVLDRSVEEAVAFADLDSEFTAAINMSATQLMRPRFVDAVRQALARHALEPHHLLIELTESVLADERIDPLLDELGDLGVRTAIDDFGTGYSSLTYVQQLPVDNVKIDRAFLVGLRADGTEAPVLKAAIDMARALDMTTTVEGVETREQLAGLRNLRADLAQGYLFSEPCPQASLLALLGEGTTW